MLAKHKIHVRRLRMQFTKELNVYVSVRDISRGQAGSEGEEKV